MKRLLAIALVISLLANLALYHDLAITEVDEANYAKGLAECLQSKK